MIPEFLRVLAKPSATLLVIGAALFVVHRFVLKAHRSSTGKKFRNQMIMLGLWAAGALVFIMALPLSETTRGQVLSLLGIVISAGIALSSTTILGNAMAGLMIRSVRAFRPGDFIEVDKHFGRVSDMGLFHTEIQTEDRDLETLPNLLLVSNAVRRVRPSGTIVSATVSLGYDVPHTQVEAQLIEAGRQSGLEEPFVRIMDLMDHAVVYKLAGFLPEVKQLLTVRSRLRTAMLDTLHAAGIEIVSPAFRNTRTVPEGTRFVPPTVQPESSAPAQPEAQDVVFDKAEAAASIESLKKMALEIEEQRETLQKAAKTHEGAVKENDEKEIARLTQRLERLAKVIELRQSRASEGE